MQVILYVFLVVISIQCVEQNLQCVMQLFPRWEVVLPTSSGAITSECGSNMDAKKEAQLFR